MSRHVGRERQDSLLPPPSSSSVFLHSNGSSSLRISCTAGHLGNAAPCWAGSSQLAPSQHEGCPLAPSSSTFQVQKAMWGQPAISAGTDHGHQGSAWAHHASLDWVAAGGAGDVLIVLLLLLTDAYADVSITAGPAGAPAAHAVLCGRRARRRNAAVVPA